MHPYNGLDVYRDWAFHRSSLLGPSKSSVNHADSFNLQMMKLQMRILYARQTNVQHKQILAKNIINRNNSYMQTVNDNSSEQLVRHRDEYHDGNGIQQSPLSQKPNSRREEKNQTPLSSYDKKPDINAGNNSIDDELDALLASNSEVYHAPSKSRPKKPMHFNQKLHTLSEEMAQAVGENSKLLTTALDDQLPVNKRKQKEKRAAHARHRQDIESQLQNQPVSAVEILPKWKHLLNNNFHPAPNKVMKSYRLFRAIAWAVVHMITNPIISINRRKSKYIERDKREFKHTLDLFTETLDDWMGKLIQLPLASIVQVHCIM
jgi:hypothetical protein